MRTVEDVLAMLPPSPSLQELVAPAYDLPDMLEGVKVGLAVESMRRHTTDEGWQLFDGLNHAGWVLCGHALSSQEGREAYSITNVPSILQTFDQHKRTLLNGQTAGGLTTVLVQDKREWTGLTAGGERTFDSRERFSSVEELWNRHDLFKLTVVKDAQHDAEFHRGAASEIGCHAWVCYYHPKIVKRLAPYVRERHLVRTYHSIDKDLVPKYQADRRVGTIISGARSPKTYPLRERLWKDDRISMHRLGHPGYHRKGCGTPDYLRLLSGFRVAICTSSIYGYTLRKIIEATACGCVVITDLPMDDVLPKIDGNLVRVAPEIPTEDLREIIAHYERKYDPFIQANYAVVAKQRYDFRVLGKKLSDDIEAMRLSYAR